MSYLRNMKLRDPLTIGLIVGGVAAATGIGTGVAGAVQQGKASDLASQQLQKQEDLLAEAEKRELEGAEDEAAIREREAGKERQRQAASLAQGRQGTILTSPLGVVSEPTLGSKTLLGL
jgi:hypothetical protein